MTTGRRLAAILAADVVGYSRLMGEDEAGTARAVREHRDAARPIVANHGGRNVKTTGDGLLLEFPSVVAAVECAIALQKLMVERNNGTPKAKRIVCRIGVNLGDVLIEGDDILGDGVNTTAVRRRLTLAVISPSWAISLCHFDQGRMKLVGEQSVLSGRPKSVYAARLAHHALMERLRCRSGATWNRELFLRLKSCR
jgi:hypothetical protein